MRIPATNNIADLQSAFRDIWSVLDKKVDVDLKGGNFQNAGDASSVLSLVTLNQLNGILAGIQKQQQEAPEPVVASFGTLLDLRVVYQTSAFTGTGTDNFPGLSFDVEADQIWFWIGGVYGISSATIWRIGVDTTVFPTVNAPGVDAFDHEFRLALVSSGQWIYDPTGFVGTSLGAAAVFSSTFHGIVQGLTPGTVQMQSRIARDYDSGGWMIAARVQ